MQKLRNVDPGTVLMLRGIRMSVSIALSGIVTFWLASRFQLANATTIAVLSGSTALFSYFLSEQGSRLYEARNLALNASVTTLVFLLGSAIDWQALESGNYLVQAVWLGAITAGFYLRGYGRFWTQLGLVASVAFMFVTLAGPSGLDASGLMLAALVAGIISVAVNTLTWVPIAERWYLREERRFLADFVAQLAQFAPESDRIAVQIWRRLNRAALRACAEAADLEPRTEMVRRLTVRMVLGNRLVALASAAIDARADPRPDLLDFTALGRDTARLVDCDTSVRHRLWQDLDTRIFARREQILNDPNLARDTKYHGLRELTGLLRIVYSLRDVLDLLAAPAPRVAPPEPDTIVAARSLGVQMSRRMAAQGFCAGLVTIVLGNLLDLNHAYWATLNVLLVLGPSLGATLQRALERVGGILAGVAFAALVNAVIGQHHAAVAAICILATLLFFPAKERSFALLAGLLGFLVPLLLIMVEDVGTPTILAWIYETAFGSAAAVLAAALVFPVKAGAFLRPLIEDLIESCRASLAHHDANETEIDAYVAGLVAAFARLRAEFVEAGSEMMFRAEGLAASQRLRTLVHNLATYTQLSIQAVRIQREDPIPPYVRDLEAELFALVDEELSKGLSPDPRPVDAEALLDRWRTAIPLDGSSPATDTVLAIEELHYVEKILETLNDLRHEINSGPLARL